jgi:PAS domain S-box-containing protein
MSECQIPAENILNDSPNPILVYDNRDTLQFVNPAFELLTGFKEDEVCGEVAPFPWWPKEDEYKLVSMLRESLKNGGKHQAMKFKNKLGRCFYVDVTTSKVNGNNQAISTWFDVTEEVEQRQKLLHMISRASAQMASLI